jgi:multiple sugar transport system permease protein
MKRNEAVKAAILYSMLIIGCIPSFYPFLWMLTSSLKTNDRIFGSLKILPEVWHWGNFLEVFRYQPFAQHYFNSVYIAIIVTILTVLIGTLSGFAFAKLNFKGKNILFLLILSSLMMPIEVTIIPNFFIMNTLNMINTHFPLIILPIFGAQGAFVAFLMRQYFITIPNELLEAPLIDGLGYWGVFFKILLPVSIPALSSAIILTFLVSWNSFLEPLVFINDIRKFTLPLSLGNFTDIYGAPIWNLQLASTTLASLPILIVFIIFQKHIVNAMVSSGVKG